VQIKLHPSCHLLKIIGPCHTVSSFLNIASVCMSQWEKALGRVTIVFTYGSGCAASMYQLRHDDLPWMKSLGVWKCDFYRDCIYQHPSTMIHDVYCQTWMKFDYRPEGRQLAGYGPDTLERDVYYLMEVDPWGRRFYHRGGMGAPPLEAKHLLAADKADNRHMRHMYGEVSEPKAPERTQEDEWKDIEYEMTFVADDAAEYDVVEESFSKSNPEHKITIVEMKDGTGKKQGVTIYNDGQEHNYQIVGSWSGWEAVEDMDIQEGGSYMFTVTLGVNRWEKFYLIQDNDPQRKIYPAYTDSSRDCPCVGPHKGGKGLFWLLDGREGISQHPEDYGNPGDKYVVTFSWATGKLKDLTWERAEEAHSNAVDKGAYYIMGSWTCWEFAELRPMDGREGCYGMEVQMTSLRLIFQIVRNKDLHQRIYPEVHPAGTGGKSGSFVLGPDGDGRGAHWEIDGEPGDVFTIVFCRTWLDDFETMRLKWHKTGHREVVEPEPRYFLVGSPTNWDADGDFIELARQPSGTAFVCEVTITRLPEEFQLLENKLWSRCIHPDKQECLQNQKHTVVKNDQGHGLNWNIGKTSADKAQIGDTFIVRLDVGEQWRVSWRKAERGAVLDAMDA